MKFLNRSNPQFSDADVRQIANNLFGLDGTFSPLSSERDQNIHITTPAGDGYVLKIAHRDETASVIDFQAQALRHLEKIAPELSVPRVVPTVDGEPFTTVTQTNGDVHLVRVVTYLAGEVNDKIVLRKRNLVSLGNRV